MDIITDRQALTEICEPLKLLTEEGLLEEECKEIILEMKKTLEENPNLTCLAAPQIGILKRVFCIRFNDIIKFFINPIISQKRDFKVIFETNISFPNKEFVIARPTEIRAVYYNEDFKYEDNKFTESAAGIFDQMSQMLDGNLPSDLGLESDISTDGKLEDLTDAEVKEVIEFYTKQYIPVKLAAIENSFSEDEKKLYKNLRFSESVVNGRTTVMEDAPKQTGTLNREMRRAITKQSKSKNKFKVGK